MNVRCEKADGSQNPVIKGGLPHASIDGIQSATRLPTRNACNCGSADPLSRFYRSKTTTPGDHQDTFRSPQSDRCNFGGYTGDLWPAWRPFPTRKQVTRGAHTERNHLIICCDRFFDLRHRGLSAHLRSAVYIKTGYLVVVPPVCP